MSDSSLRADDGTAHRGCSDPKKAAKHTPGPWRLATKSNIGNLVEAYTGKHTFAADDGMRPVATFQDCCASNKYDEQEANRLANGRLIAAAPELLEALKAMHAAFNAKHPIPKKEGDALEAMCRAAIAKAEGR